MRYFIMSLVLGCVLFGCSEVWAITGNDWLGIGQLSQMYYIMGLIEGWHGFLTTEEKYGDKMAAVYLTYKTVDTCVTPMTYKQATAIVEKHLKDNPNVWHHSMESLAWTAFYQSCAKEEK